MPAFKPDKPKTADRGKAAEQAVQTCLEELSAKRSTFDYLRLPDVRSAMGRMKAMPADFEFFAPLSHGLIEVKETEHNFRISKDKVPQLPMMRKRVLAGGVCYLLVHHSTLKKWRAVPVQALDPSVPSWDLTAWPLLDNAAKALDWLEYTHVG